MTNLPIKLVSELKSKNSFIKLINDNQFKSKVLYVLEKKNIQISDAQLNFTNTMSSKRDCFLINQIILTELYRLEQVSPKASNYLYELLERYFKLYTTDLFKHQKTNIEKFLEIELEKFNSKMMRFQKDDVVKYLGTIKNKKINNIIKTLFSIMEFNDLVYVEETNFTETFFKKSDKLSFKLKFDQSFLLEKSWKCKDYRFIIIDGYIDSLGEIHHLLEVANKNREPYVVFCKGMSDEVKHAILYNLKRRTINLMPICLDINEENVNILNDIAACHDADIVSSFKGDTISSSVRRELPKGKNFYVDNNGIFYFDCLSEKTKNRQKKYLNKKLATLDIDDPNKSFIINRLKFLNSRKITLYLDTTFNNFEKKELDSYLKQIAYLKSGCAYKTKNNKIVEIYTYKELYIIFKKFQSIVKSLSNIGNSIFIDKGE